MHSVFIATKITSKTKKSVFTNEYVHINILKNVQTRNIQRTQTPPRLLHLNLTCNFDIMSRSKMRMSLDVT